MRINRAAWTLRRAGVRSVGHHAGRASMSRRRIEGAAELAAKKKPWAISRANTYKGAGLPKGANTGGATLGRRSHARTRTDHNQRANSFGPNELRAIATSGDTMPFVWDFQL